MFCWKVLKRAVSVDSNVMAACGISLASNVIAASLALMLKISSICSFIVTLLSFSGIGLLHCLIVGPFHLEVSLPEFGS